MPFLRGLGAEELARLRDLAILFLAEKEMHGAQGLELTDEARLSIAVQACLPVLVRALRTRQRRDHIRADVGDHAPDHGMGDVIETGEPE